MNENDYRAMLMNFRVSDLQKLLKPFGKNLTGRRFDLQYVALDMLNSKPIDLNYGAFLIRILEIHNDQMSNSMRSQQKRFMYMNHNTRVPQQRMQTYINPIEAKYISGNAMAINNIQPVPSNYQPIRHKNVVSSQFLPNQHNYMSNMKTQNSVRFYLKTMNSQNTPVTLTPEIVVQYKFKKLPFYEVQEDIIKPTLLIESEKCSLATASKGTSEFKLVHTMSLEQASLIAMNRDISHGKNKYLYQYQIRFCRLEFGRSEVTDFLPLGLHIRIGEKICTLPPIASTQQIFETPRRIAGPIDCTQILKLNPNLANHITLNWLPDGKAYAVAVFLVKKLSPDDLVKKLLEKESKSSEETRNYIIKKLENVDTDLTTTSYHFSLLCPLSKSRMTLPAKSIQCDHLQCFDAETFISMNEKKPTWTCPTCNKPILYEDISIENYILEIIKSPLLQVNDEEIEFLADGSWIICKEKNNKYIKNTKSTLDTAKSTVFIDVDDSGDEIATEPKIDLRPEDSGKQESIDYINVDDSGDEIATEPKIDLRPEDSGKQESIDYINVDDSGDEIATEPKIDLRPEDSGKQESIDYINVDDSDDEIATESKKGLRPEDSGKQESIDYINVDDSDDEIATESKKGLRPEDSGNQKSIDYINVDDSDDEIATESKKGLRPKDSGNQKSIDYINVDDSDDEIATESKKGLRPEDSGNQKSIDYINVDDSDDEIATESKKGLRPKDSGNQKSIDYINVDDSDDEIATESKKGLRPEDSGNQKSIDYINVDDSDDEIATESKKGLRPEDSGNQKSIDYINVDDSGDEIATEPKIDHRPKDYLMQEIMDYINVDDSDNETATELTKEFRPESSEKQESKNLKPYLIDLTINEDEEPSKHEDKLENESQAADVEQPVTQLVLQPKKTPIKYKIIQLGS